MKKRSVLTVLIATLLVAAMAITADAQGRRGGQGGQRGGGPGGGPGGFGGGMMMGRGGFGGFGGGSLLQLARIPAVQQEIEATEGQVEKINAIAEEMRPQRGQGGERPSFRDMSDEERQKAFEEMRKQFEERAKAGDKKLKEAIFPHQVERLEEIRIQQMGLRALSDPQVAAALKLKTEQKEKIEKVGTDARDKMRQEMQALFSGGQRPDREEMQKKMTEFREKTEKDTLAVLTAEQKKKFEELKGEPFEMPRPQFGGRGGRGGQGGGPGGRGGRGGEGGGAQGRPARPGF